jgi:hypothetical protein
MVGDLQIGGTKQFDYATAVKFYGKAAADKLAAQGKTSTPAPASVPPPVAPDTGDVYGTPEQIKDRLLKRYAAGEIPQNVSAEITSNPATPGQQKIVYSSTPSGEQSQIKYYAPISIADTQPMPEGKLQYTYNLGVEYPEQEAGIRKWAASQGIKVNRDLSGNMTAGAAPINLVLTSDKELPSNASVDITSGEAVREARTLRSAQGIGQKIYQNANPLEKAIYNVRTLLSPAGYEYVGAVARGPLGLAGMGPGSLTLVPIIDAIFPNIKTSEQVVTQDIEKTMGSQVLGQKTSMFGIEIPEAVISAINNPVVDVVMMALGGAGAAKFAATSVGKKIVTSGAGKIGSMLLTAGYAVEKTMEVQLARSSGNNTEALGKAITSAAGLGASALAYKAEFSHIITARTQHILKVDMSKIAGASESVQTQSDIMTSDNTVVKQGTTVSKGKFKIMEGELRGLTGETRSISGESTGKLVTHIPEQTLEIGGKEVKIPEQDYTAATRFGTVSEKLKLYWREAGDYLVGQGKKSKIFGPNKEQTLMKELSSQTLNVKVSTPLEGGGQVEVTKEGIVRKFKGISSGKQAKYYDMYIVQQDDKLILAEQAVIGKRSIAKIDWVDITFTGKGGEASMDVYSGGAVKLVTTTATATKLAPPAIPGLMSVKVAAAAEAVAVAPRIVWSANPTPGPGVMLKKSQKIETIKIDIGVPAIIRTPTTQQERGGTVVQRTTNRTISIPSIKRTTTVSPKIDQRTVVIPVTSPITGQKVTEKERAAVLQQLNPIITRIANQPVNTTPTPNVMPAIVIPNLGLVPFLRMGPYSVKIEKFAKGLITNPVPNIERLI